ncbi:rRNA maturation RNase YbeY [Lachnospiraceae bacterium OttesenSCG-928-D06]|nr:rRNA maturation RNase YbeY [Lachnospiraceae bacterium OttesenSCG-928-D06]
MTFQIETNQNEFNTFSIESIVKLVAASVLDEESCPYEAEVNVIITDNETIREYNREYREIDRATDVLSFPNIEFQKAGLFSIPKEDEFHCFNPDSGELILGDIIVSADKVREQAVSYGHSEKREFAFLIAHSMLHLCGYDHMEEEEAHIMEAKQNKILENLGITREE